MCASCALQTSGAHDTFICLDPQYIPKQQATDTKINTNFSKLVCLGGTSWTFYYCSEYRKCYNCMYYGRFDNERNDAIVEWHSDECCAECALSDPHISTSLFGNEQKRETKVSLSFGEVDKIEEAMRLVERLKTEAKETLVTRKRILNGDRHFICPKCNRPTFDESPAVACAYDCSCIGACSRCCMDIRCCEPCNLLVHIACLHNSTWCGSCCKGVQMACSLNYHLPKGICALCSRNTLGCRKALRLSNGMVYCSTCCSSSSPFVFATPNTS